MTYVNMPNDAVLPHLGALGAPTEYISWAREHGGDLDALLRDCTVIDWLLWYAGKVLSERAMRLLACDFASHVLPIFEDIYPDDSRPREAIEVARRFANDDATKADLCAARWASVPDCAPDCAGAADAAAYYYVYAAAFYAAGAAAARAAAAARLAADCADDARRAERAWQREQIVSAIRGVTGVEDADNA